MIRMGKLADYGIVLMTHFATAPHVQHSAHSLADAVNMPLPTVRKVLKALTNSGLLRSARGVQGGYQLRRSPEAISIAQVIVAIEGPIALTECVSTDHQCDQEAHCQVQTNWSRINAAVFHALDEVKLTHLLAETRSSVSPIHFYAKPGHPTGLHRSKGDPA